MIDNSGEVTTEKPHSNEYLMGLFCVLCHSAEYLLRSRLTHCRKASIAEVMQVVRTEMQTQL